MDDLGNDGQEQDPGPIDHWVNFKTRRVRMGRGEGQHAAALADGFKKVTQKHFVSYLDKARNGFRRKPKAKGARHV
jgi:hypothetical protein